MIPPTDPIRTRLVYHYPHTRPFSANKASRSISHNSSLYRCLRLGDALTNALVGAGKCGVSLLVWGVSVQYSLLVYALVVLTRSDFGARSYPCPRSYCCADRHTSTWKYSSSCVNIGTWSYCRTTRYVQQFQSRCRFEVVLGLVTTTASGLSRRRTMSMSPFVL